MRRPTVPAPALAVVPIALAAAVYLPLRHVWFFSDDLMHLLEAESDPVLAFLLKPFGGHNYLVRNVVLLASYELFGLRAGLYYWTVLATHLANVALLFAVVRVLCGSAWLACLMATLWGTSPVLVGALGWYSVYGQVLGATIFLGVLLSLARLAGRHADIPPRTAIVWLLLLLAGTTCFGTGIAIALAFPVVLFALSDEAWRRPGVRWAGGLLPLATIGLYVALRRLYPYIAPLSWQETFQEQVALSGLASAPAMAFHLLGFSLTATLLGFFAPTTSYSARTTAIALTIFVAGLAFVVARGDRRTRRIAFAMLAVAAAIYGLVAAGRAALYAAIEVPAAKAATVARYHYAGSIPVVVLLTLLVQQLGRLPVLRSAPRAAVLAVALAIGAYGFASAGSPVTQLRTQCRDYFVETMQGIAYDVRAATPGDPVYLDNRTTPRFVLGITLPEEAFPGRAAVFLLAQRSEAMDGRKVRFVEHDEDVLSYYRARPQSRLARLLVGPDVAAH